MDGLGATGRKVNPIAGLYARIVGLMTAGLFLLLLLAVAGIFFRPGWRAWQSYQQVKTAGALLRQIAGAEGTILHRDEVLTMSAMMAAAAGEPSPPEAPGADPVGEKWITRYEEFGPRINPAIKNIVSMYQDDTVSAGAVLATLASTKLDKMESEALDLVRRGDRKAAAALLCSPEYEEQKQVYQKGMTGFVGNARSALESRRDKDIAGIVRTLAEIGATLLLAIFVWLVAHRLRRRLADRMRTEQKLTAFAQEWQETFNAITDGVCIIDKATGRILQCNRGMTGLLKKSYGEIIGASCCELMHGSAEPVKKCPLVRMWNTRRSETAVVQMGEKWLQIKVDPVINNKGQLVGAVHVASDITERKNADEALQESEKKFRLAFANAQDAILWTDIESGAIINCNKAAEELFGKTRGQIVGQHYTALGFDDKSERVRALFKEPGADQKNSVEVEIPTTSGERKTVTIAVSTMLVERKEIVQAIIRDITGRKKAEKEKIDLEVQLSQKQKMEAIGTLAGGIAHDFNNILAAMQGYVELSLEDLPEDAAVRDNLEQVLSCGNRAAKLVRQILTFSRKDQQEKGVLQISSIVKEVLKMLRSSLPATIKIRRKIEADSSLVLADPTQLHQVLVNLCTNASHAMGEAGGLLEVSLIDVNFESETKVGDESLPRGPYVKLSVSDTGCGMEKEVMERIFEPFFTTKKVNEGTGLGLSVVHGIVKSHNGAIAVDSTPGKGSTFDIFFPKVESNEVQAPESSEPVTRKQEVILLVDDEKVMVDVTKQILERLGYTVVATTSSIVALEAFQEEPDEFDLVITDQTMPNMTGTQLARELIAVKPDIPVILCSGYPENVNLEEVRSIGIKKFITKPISKQDIAALIREVLDRERVTA
jgi:PAS domain S-box-containing protein